MAFPDLDPNQVASQEMAGRVARAEAAKAAMAGKPFPGASVQTAPLPDARAKPAPSAPMPKNPLLDAAKAPPPKPAPVVTPAPPTTPPPVTGSASVPANGLGRSGIQPRPAAPAAVATQAAGNAAPVASQAAKAGISKTGLVGGALVEGLNTYDDIQRTPEADGLLQAGRVAEGVGKVAGAALGATAGAAVGGPLAPLTGLAGGVAGYFAPELVTKAANFVREKSNQYLGTDIPEFQLSSQRMADMRGETPAPAAVPAAAAKPAAADPVGINGTLPPQRPIPQGITAGTGEADFNAGNQSVTPASGLTPSAVDAGNANLRANLRDGSGQRGSFGTYGDGSTSEQRVARINADIAALQGLHQARVMADTGGAGDRRGNPVIDASPSSARAQMGDMPTRNARGLSVEDLKRMTPQMREAALKLEAIRTGQEYQGERNDVAMEQAQAAAENAQAQAAQDAAEADAEARRGVSAQALEMLKLRKPEVIDQYDADGNKIGQILVDPFTGRPINQTPPGLADGGYVDPRLGAPGTDTIQAAVQGKPIRLDGGEYVLPADTTQAIGRRALDATVAATHKPKRAAPNGAANGGLMASLFKGVPRDRAAQIDKAVDGAAAPPPPPPRPTPPVPPPSTGGQSMADIMREIRAKNPAY